MLILGICDEPSIKEVLSILGTVIKIIKVAVPILLLISGALLYMKTMKDKDVDLPSANKSLVRKCIAAALIFLVPTFVGIIAKVSGITEYSSCLNSTTKSVVEIRIEQMDRYVSKAEETESLSDYSTAILYLPKINDQTAKNQYFERLDKVKKTIDEREKTIDITSSTGEFVYYCQGDYSSTPYGGGSIASSGCGPTSAAMILTYLLGREITPIETAEWSTKNGYVDNGGGTYNSMFTGIAKAYGVNEISLSPTAENIRKYLSEGYIIAAHMGPGEFTSGGHYIVLRSIEADGTVTVADPAHPNKTTGYSPELIASESKANMHAFSN